MNKPKNNHRPAKEDEKIVVLGKTGVDEFEDVHPLVDQATGILDLPEKKAILEIYIDPLSGDYYEVREISDPEEIKRLKGLADLIFGNIIIIVETK